MRLLPLKALWVFAAVEYLYGIWQLLLFTLIGLPWIENPPYGIWQQFQEPLFGFERVLTDPVANVLPDKWSQAAWLAPGLAAVGVALVVHRLAAGGLPVVRRPVVRTIQVVLAALAVLFCYAVFQMSYDPATLVERSPFTPALVSVATIVLIMVVGNMFVRRPVRLGTGASISYPVLACLPFLRFVLALVPLALWVHWVRNTSSWDTSFAKILLWLFLASFAGGLLGNVGRVAVRQLRLTWLNHYGAVAPVTVEGHSWGTESRGGMIFWGTGWYMWRVHSPVCHVTVTGVHPQNDRRFATVITFQPAAVPRLGTTFLLRFHPADPGFNDVSVAHR
ncbi:hypothetical protein [Actinomadura oligospora]|uniref:hypothetical protein n=1 Tax=Actinomadura oligospora TaxID=111804 RepID=UPI00047B1C4B|nr:hypothetical protein [Actinomadura oligospora]